MYSIAGRMPVNQLPHTSGAPKGASSLPWEVMLVMSQLSVLNCGCGMRIPRAIGASDRIAMIWHTDELTTAYQCVMYVLRLSN